MMVQAIKEFEVWGIHGEGPSSTSRLSTVQTRTGRKYKAPTSLSGGGFVHVNLWLFFVVTGLLALDVSHLFE